MENGDRPRFPDYLTCPIQDHRLIRDGPPRRIFAVSMDRGLSTCRAAPAWLSRAYPGTSSSEVTTVRPLSMTPLTTSIFWPPAPFCRQATHSCRVCFGQSSVVIRILPPVRNSLTVRYSVPYRTLPGSSSGVRPSVFAVQSDDHAAPVADHGENPCCVAAHPVARKHHPRLWLAAHTTENRWPKKHLPAGCHRLPGCRVSIWAGTAHRFPFPGKVP